jgi:hypothetical protein
VKELRVRNVELRKNKEDDRDINRRRVVQYMHDMGINIVFVDLLESDTEDGQRQCKTCLHTKPLEQYRVKGNGGKSKPASKHCALCREHRGGTYVMQEQAE